jgi:hypothetical protein
MAKSSFQEELEQRAGRAILARSVYRWESAVIIALTVSLAILSLAVEKPRHGYEMEQVIEGRGMREWTEVGFSSISATRLAVQAISSQSR